MKFAGIGGVVFASGLGWPARSHGASGNPSDTEDFYFVQLSDTHWGFTGPEANPDAAGTLPKAVAAVNNLSTQPDFIVFTGDLSHITEDCSARPITPLTTKVCISSSSITYPIYEDG